MTLRTKMSSSKNTRLSHYMPNALTRPKWSKNQKWQGQQCPRGFMNDGASQLSKCRRRIASMLFVCFSAHLCGCRVCMFSPCDMLGKFVGDSKLAVDVGGDGCLSLCVSSAYSASPPMSAWIFHLFSNLLLHKVLKEKTLRSIWGQPKKLLCLSRCSKIGQGNLSSNGLFFCSNLQIRRWFISNEKKKRLLWAATFSSERVLQFLAKITKKRSISTFVRVYFHLKINTDLVHYWVFTLFQVYIRV